MELSEFYNHASFMQCAQEGALTVAREEKALAAKKKQVSTLKNGDIVESTGMGCRKAGTKAKIIKIEYNGPFLRFYVDWDFMSRKKRHCITGERLQDIKKSVNM